MRKSIVVIIMNKIVELPLIEPVYSTYHFQGPGTAVIANNPSIRNWYLNSIFELSWNRGHLNAKSAPKINVEGSGWPDNPLLEKHWYSAQFLNGHINVLIRNMLDAGYYVLFGGIDDYYIKGKSWYKERHFTHDGLICGYSREDKAYCIYAYDSNWVYQKFWTPQSCFDAGRKAMEKKGIYTQICGIKPLQDEVNFSPQTALEKIAKYIDTSSEKNSDNGQGYAYGIIVHDYVAEYIGELFDGSIAYEKKDRRIFRLIWEHKKVLLECIVNIEKSFDIGKCISYRYADLVSESDAIRMLYASYVIKQRDSVLPIIQKKLLAVKAEEEKLLKELLEKTGGVKAE